MSKKSKKKNNSKSVVISLILLICLYVYNNYQEDINKFIENIIPISLSTTDTVFYGIDEVPEYNGKNYVVIDENEPSFTDDEKNTISFEKYSNLDSLGRCGVAYANISLETMPTEKRESIGSVKPSGWHLVKYDIVEGKYLYNRCHLIAFQLAGENANNKNLITCTRQMNTVGMLEFENKVATYVKNTGNHVLYRVTPIFKENNLLATGVQMEAYSVEDNGKGIKFNVFVYNVQDGIDINYLTGESNLK